MKFPQIIGIMVLPQRRDEGLNSSELMEDLMLYYPQRKPKGRTLAGNSRKMVLRAEKRGM